MVDLTDITASHRSPFHALNLPQRRREIDAPASGARSEDESVSVPEQVDPRHFIGAAVIVQKSSLPLGLETHSPSQRCRRLVLKAWSRLRAMKKSDALATIEEIRAECDPARMETVDLDCALLHAVSMALNDDAKRAAQLAGDALMKYDGGATHPATLLLIRMGHWKARRLGDFCDLSGSVNYAPTHRREALLSILHLSMEAAIEAEQLRERSAARLADEALTLTTHFFGTDASRGRLATTLNARALYEQGNIDAADRLIRDKLVLGSIQGGIEGALGSYLVAARIAAARGQRPFAILLLREAELLGKERHWPRLVAVSLGERVRLHVEDGRIGDAESCAARLDQMSRSAIETNDRLLAREVAVARIRIALARGLCEQAVPALRQIVKEAWDRRENRVAVKMLMLLAAALRSAGQEQEARTHALRAVELGAAADLHRTLLDGGEANAEMLRWLYERRDEGAAVLGELRPYVRNLVAKAAQRPAPLTGARTRHRSGESLSSREARIVTLMSHGLSNKRIARALGIAPETVKSHAKHIFVKLGAQTRVEAVSRALSLGMV